MGTGRHSITCPFEDQHSDVGRAPGDGDTVYLEPHYNGVPVGVIKCEHTHRSSQVDFWKAIGYDGTEADELDLDVHLIKHFDVADRMEEIPHVIDRWVPMDEVTLLAAHGGSGKSYVALLLALHVALGNPFAGLLTKQRNVLFFSGEDGARVLRHRLAKICRSLKIDVADLDGKLHLLDASYIDPALYREQRTGSTTVTETALLGRQTRRLRFEPALHRPCLF